MTKKPLLEWECDEKHGEHMVHTTTIWMRLTFYRNAWVATVWPMPENIMDTPLASVNMHIDEAQLGMAKAIAMTLFEEVLSAVR